MSLMFRKKGIVYLSKTHISLYYKDITNPLRVDFELNILENHAKIDKEWIRNAIKVLENKVKLKKLKAILILSKDIVFDKIIDEENPDKRTLEINEFLGSLPIGINLVEDKEFVKEGNVLITATNKNIYMDFIEVLKPINIDIEYVLPEIVFNRIEFNKDFLDEIYSEKILLKFGNYLEEKEKSISWNAKTTYKVIILMLSIGLSLGFVFYKLDTSKFMNFIKNLNIETIKENKPMEAESAKEEPKVEEATKEEEKTIDKDIIQIQILNGTGIPGFAGEIGDLVKSVGYKNITTANAGSFNYTNTVIEVDELIPSKQINEIRESLKTKLKSFEIKQTKGLDKKIIITTGEVIQKN